MRIRFQAAALAACCLLVISACGEKPAAPGDTAAPPPVSSSDGTNSTGSGTGTGSGTPGGEPAKPAGPTGGGSGTTPTTTVPAPGGASKPGSGTTKPDAGKTAVQVVAKPNDVAVLVNKTYKLPDNYKPDDLVEPDIPFIFKEKSDKRLMRKEAAGALEKLVAAAEKDGISLAGVSGYRSQATQKTLFDNYVKKDGEEAARKYSAVPGHSEHQTGLAMDISGSDGKCAASDCFAGTKEAKWLADHAAEHGFIIRYPKGKEDVTGYQYEPWHLRYVGTKAAKEIAEKGVTLEEYTQNAVPVSK
ncbi:M15 family metallopeptidase [Paenibacillus flagellatus]|uniref:Peptidase M15 n=1 Tax=Paenibacillus flagellatus TaxID=2211139 RepID=A0A2V5KAX1_9BACL|nr:peptidase M15 [Paenibacillus flagellatus]